MLQKSRWLRISLVLSLLIGASAWALRAACSDGCPPSCPMHSNAPLQDCTINYDANGKMTSAICRYQDGCSFSNAGGGTSGDGKIKHKTQ